MGRIRLEFRVLAFAFLCLCVTENGLATKREDLERAAELAVERAAERAAERAVEKALESGNSTTETETIRESYSSVRKSDKTIKLPGSGYTPAQRREYDRIMREREAGERATALLKRSVDNGRDKNVHEQLWSPDVDKNDHCSHKDDQKPSTPAKTFPEMGFQAIGPFDVTRQVPVPDENYKSPFGSFAVNDRQHLQGLPDQAHAPRNGDQFFSLYPVKVFAIPTTKPYSLKPLRFIGMKAAPAAIATANDDGKYPHFIDRVPRVSDADGDYFESRDERRSGQGWIYQ